MTHHLPGPGDPATWPAYTGHPNDPRRDDLYDEPEIADPDEHPCPTCAGNGIYGPAATPLGWLAYSPAESKLNRPAFRSAGGELREPRWPEGSPALDVFEGCPTCAGDGINPDARCRRHPTEPSILDDTGAPTGACFDCWTDEQREHAAEIRAGI